MIWRVRFCPFFRSSIELESCPSFDECLSGIPVPVVRTVRDGSIRAPVQREPDETETIEERRLVATKAHSLRWLEKIRESQRLTAREERRKEEILAVFRQLRAISARRFDLPDFPPPQYPW